MPRNDNLAIFLTIVWALFMESAQTPFRGFYLAPAVLALILFFFSPFIYRSLNALCAGFLSFCALCVWEWRILYFTIPYFLILFLIIYVFAKK